MVVQPPITTCAPICVPSPISTCSPITAPGPTITSLPNLAFGWTMAVLWMLDSAIFHAYNYHYNHSSFYYTRANMYSPLAHNLSPNIGTAFNLAHFTFNFNNIYLHANLIARFYRMAETHFINTCKHRSKTTIFLRV